MMSNKPMKNGGCGGHSVGPVAVAAWVGVTPVERVLVESVANSQLGERAC